MYGLLVSILHGNNDSEHVSKLFQKKAKRAAKADVFPLWPFPATVAGRECAVTAQHSLADLVHAAFPAQCLEPVLAAMQPWLMSLPATDPLSSTPLMHFLELLAAAYSDASTSLSCQLLITNIMSVWGLTSKQLVGVDTIWVTQPVSGRRVTVYPSQHLQLARAAFSDVSVYAASQVMDQLSMQSLATMDLDETIPVSTAGQMQCLRGLHTHLQVVTSLASPAVLLIAAPAVGQQC